MRTRGINANVVREERPEFREWVVSYLPTKRSRKPRTYIGYGATEEDAKTWVMNFIDNYNKDSLEFANNPKLMTVYKIVSVERCC